MGDDDWTTRDPVRDPRIQYTGDPQQLAAAIQEFQAAPSRPASQRLAAALDACPPSPTRDALVRSLAFGAMMRPSGLALLRSTGSPSALHGVHTARELHEGLPWLGASPGSLGTIVRQGALHQFVPDGFTPPSDEESRVETLEHLWLDFYGRLALDRSTRSKMVEVSGSCTPERSFFGSGGSARVLLQYALGMIYQRRGSLTEPDGCEVKSKITSGLERGKWRVRTIRTADDDDWSKGDGLERWAEWPHLPKQVSGGWRPTAQFNRGTWQVDVNASYVCDYATVMEEWLWFAHYLYWLAKHLGGEPLYPSTLYTGAFSYAFAAGRIALSAICEVGSTLVHEFYHRKTKGHCETGCCHEEAASVWNARVMSYYALFDTAPSSATDLGDLLYPDGGDGGEVQRRSYCAGDDTDDAADEELKCASDVESGTDLCTFSIMTAPGHRGDATTWERSRTWVKPRDCR